tara:strand:- start:7517 stop:8164 length:648 start_codon:yes stop_codon:yes gene_type:complete
MTYSLKKLLVLVHTVTLLSLILTYVESATATQSTCVELYQAQKQGARNPLYSWLSQRKERHPRRWNTITQITVSGKTYHELTSLGDGGEGEVYFGQSNTGPAAIKVFHSRENFKKAKKEYKIYARWLPKLITADEATHTIVMEYKEGIDVYTIVKHGDEFGISDKQIESIKLRWEKWAGEQKTTLFPLFRRRPTFLWQNVIYSFTEDRFYLIDAF